MTATRKVHLAYELFLTNTLPQPVTLRAILRWQTGLRLQSPITEYLLPWVKVFGATEPTTILGPGQSALAWLDVTVRSPADIPRGDGAPDIVAGHHPESASVAGGSDGDCCSDGGVQGVCDHNRSAIEGLELARRQRLSVTAHRGAVSSLKSSLFAPERFAIDYVQLTSDGKMFNGDRTSVNSYPTTGRMCMRWLPERSCRL